MSNKDFVDLGMSILAYIVFSIIWEIYVGTKTYVWDYFWCFVLYIITNVIHSFLIEVKGVIK